MCWKASLYVSVSQSSLGLPFIVRWSSNYSSSHGLPSNIAREIPPFIVRWSSNSNLHRVWWIFPMDLGEKPPWLGHASEPTRCRSEPTSSNAACCRASHWQCRRWRAAASCCSACWAWLSLVEPCEAIMGIGGKFTNRKRSWSNLDNILVTPPQTWTDGYFLLPPHSAGYRWSFSYISHVS